jgi:hypothetical protein
MSKKQYEQSLELLAALPRNWVNGQLVYDDEEIESTDGTTS